MSWASAEREPWRGAAGAALLAALTFLGACGPERPPRAQAIGEAYVAPESLNLRKEIPLQSGVAATLKRGERVEILGRRHRRFVKVRTAANQEGWTEQSQLLTPEAHQRIEEQARQAAALPHLGVYRARDTLNIHLEPYRWSPGVHQLREGEKVDLLGRRVSERTSGPPTSSAQPKAFDDWCLVRTAGGRAGWVLARLIDADIPDEVAQYAEGRRITSYFELGEVVDGQQVKKTWLWTTAERGLLPHDYDYIRLFRWGRRKHRYETAYLERGLTGYFPVTATPSVQTRYGTGPGFSMVVEKADGRRWTRRYVLIGHVVRRYAEEPAPAAPAPAAPVTSLAPAAPGESPGLLARWWRRVFSR